MERRSRCGDSAGPVTSRRPLAPAWSQASLSPAPGRRAQPQVQSCESGPGVETGSWATRLSRWVSLPPPSITSLLLAHPEAGSPGREMLRPAGRPGEVAPGEVRRQPAERERSAAATSAPGARRLPVSSVGLEPGLLGNSTFQLRPPWPPLPVGSEPPALILRSVWGVVAATN